MAHHLFGVNDDSFWGALDVRNVRQGRPVATQCYNSCMYLELHGMYSASPRLLKGSASSHIKAGHVLHTVVVTSGGSCTAHVRAAESRKADVSLLLLLQ